MQHFHVRLRWQELEESWGLRLETQAHYSEATERCSKVLQELPDGLAPKRDGALALACQTEPQVRTEYTRVLLSFTDLIVYAKMPA